MTRFTKILMGATALSMLAGVAYAEGNNNESEIHQNGDDNVGVVSQDGDNNRAGFGAYDANNWTLRQDGDQNTLTIDQNGDQNSVGLSNAYSHNGVKQVGDRNQLNIEQNGIADGYSSNIVGTVKQTGSATATATTNTVDIDQTGSASIPAYGHHFVGQITQENTTGGDANSISILQIGGGFAAGNRTNQILQVGSNNDVDLNQAGALNKTTLVTQNGSSNLVDVDQSNAAAFGTPTYPYPAGTWGNIINEIDQDGDGNSATVSQTGVDNLVNIVDQNSVGAGLGNTAIVSLTGDRNGAAALTGAASMTGAVSSNVVQTGGGNEINYTVSGASDNSFGFEQNGTGNKAVGILIIGDSNQLGVSPVGTDNQLVLSTISGESNNIGLDQDGDDNVATINVSGDFNGGGLLAGVAGDLASPNGLVSGLIIQDGLRNDVNLNITSSNDNQFAFLQDGNDNNIIGNVSGGGSNSATFVQNGNNNTSNWSQSGSFNQVSVNQ